MTRKLLAMALAGAALALGACGEDDEDRTEAGNPNTQPPQPPDADNPPEPGSERGSKLRADADPGGELKFTTDRLEARQGNVTITMANPSDLPHAIAVEGQGIDESGETVEKGGNSTLTLELKPGEYEFYCPVPGHEEGGMKGTLTVK